MELTPNPLCRKSDVTAIVKSLAHGRNIHNIGDLLCFEKEEIANTSGMGQKRPALAEKIYNELLGFAITKKEIFFGQSLVRLPKDLLRIATVPIHSAVADTKLDGCLIKRNINYLIDAMCFTERDLKTILCIADTEKIVKQLYSFNVPVGILKNPKTKVVPKGHKNNHMEICCQFLAA